MIWIWFVGIILTLGFVAWHRKQKYEEKWCAADYAIVSVVGCIPYIGFVLGIGFFAIMMKTIIKNTQHAQSYTKKEI
ncbi:MAG: hypothetical protein J6X18_16965 [Bacteroidales bacterium]|nr:hypothetical protein [Bacteroidales bacterium]